MKILTWNDLKTFANSIGEEYLNQHIDISVVDGYCTNNALAEVYSEDYLVNSSDNDDQGYRSEVERWCENGDADIDDYDVLFEKGRPVIHIENNKIKYESTNP